TDLARLAKVIPGQLRRAGIAHLDNQGAGCIGLPSLPGSAVAFFVFGTKGDTVLKRQHLEATFTQSGQYLLVQQHVVRVRYNPQPGQDERECLQNAIDSLRALVSHLGPGKVRHAEAKNAEQIRRIRSEFSSGGKTSASARSSTRPYGS